MRSAIHSLVIAAVLSVPAIAQERASVALPDPGSQSETVAASTAAVPEFTSSDDIKIDDRGIVIDGKRRFMVGWHAALSTLRVAPDRIDDRGIIIDGNRRFMVGWHVALSTLRVAPDVPKSDSAMVYDGKHAFFVRWRPQNSTLRVLPSSNRMSATETVSAEATAPAASISSVDAREIQPDPPLSVETSDVAAAGLSLSSPAPNPVIAATTINFSLARAAVVNLTVYDAAGHPVATLADDAFGAGTHQVRFDASGLAAGTYYYRLSSDGTSETKSMTVVK